MSDDLKEAGQILKEGRLLLREACLLLHACLEWDNGVERDYEKIVEFLNKVEGN